ncbi:MAG: bacillithiol system redox-active protein YtxJ [Acidobacteriota bacterium]|nr:bacillithiol system redox-active protein YtxJ [Acidobacteriota bacterium]
MSSIMESGLSKITTLEELDRFLAESNERPIWLLKHSLACPLSTEGLREFQRFAASAADAGSFAVVEVQNARAISDELARRTEIRHETPQAIMFVHGRPRWHGSHWAITCEALGRATREIGSATGSGSG